MTSSSNPSAIGGFMLFIAVLTTALVLLVHSAVTSFEVPANVLADCVGAQVLDPVTHTCGGV